MDANAILGPHQLSIVVKALWPDANPELWKFSEPACPKGDKEHFRFTGPGNEVDAWLFEYDV